MLKIHAISRKKTEHLEIQVMKIFFPKDRFDFQLKDRTGVSH